MGKQEEHKNWGGARPGAGRKQMGESPKTQTVGFRLRPELKDLLFQKAEERGISASELVAQLIETLSD